MCSVQNPVSLAKSLQKWVTNVKNTQLPSNLIHNLSFMRITARSIIRYNSACGRNWRRRAHRANVTNRHQTKTVEKFGKDSPTVFIYRFSGISASSYPLWSIKRSSENISKSIECSNAWSMDTRQSLKAFYTSIWYGCPVVYSSWQHCKLYVFIKLTAQNYGFSWGPANFFR